MAYKTSCNGFCLIAKLHLKSVLYFPTDTLAWMMYYSNTEFTAVIRQMHSSRWVFMHPLPFSDCLICLKFASILWLKRFLLKLSLSWPFQWNLDFFPHLIFSTLYTLPLQQNSCYATVFAILWSQWEHGAKHCISSS